MQKWRPLARLKQIPGSRLLSTECRPVVGPAQPAPRARAPPAAEIRDTALPAVNRRALRMRGSRASASWLAHYRRSLLFFPPS